MEFAFTDDIVQQLAERMAALETRTQLAESNITILEDQNAHRGRELEIHRTAIQRLIHIAREQKEALKAATGTLEAITGQIDELRADREVARALQPAFMPIAPVAQYVVPPASSTPPTAPATPQSFDVNDLYCQELLPAGTQS